MGRNKEEIVCPTCVGMNRSSITHLVAPVGMPHVCGDEPMGLDLKWIKSRMPHVCGDEPETVCALGLMASVCPTCVGMNRCSLVSGFPLDRMPHVCGDEPTSPSITATVLLVCPTCVGMNRWSTI